MASQEIHAAGAVVWRADGGALEVAVVHRPRYDDWSLPKGKLDPGESARTAAWREVREETGARVALGHSLARIRYEVGAAGKVVDYFAARYVSGSFEPSDEVDELRPLSHNGQKQVPPIIELARTYDADRACSAPPAAAPVGQISNAMTGTVDPADLGCGQPSEEGHSASSASAVPSTRVGVSPSNSMRRP